MDALVCVLRLALCRLHGRSRAFLLVVIPIVSIRLILQAVRLVLRIVRRPLKVLRVRDRVRVSSGIFLLYSGKYCFRSVYSGPRGGPLQCA